MMYACDTTADHNEWIGQYFSYVAIASPSACRRDGMPPSQPPDYPPSYRRLSRRYPSESEPRHCLTDGHTRAARHVSRTLSSHITSGLWRLPQTERLDTWIVCHGLAYCQWQNRCRNLFQTYSRRLVYSRVPPIALILAFTCGRIPSCASPKAKRSPSLLMSTGIPNTLSSIGPRATPLRNEGSWEGNHRLRHVRNPPGRGKRSGLPRGLRKWCYYLTEPPILVWRRLSRSSEFEG